MDKLDSDRRFDSREDFILSTVLAGCEILMEPNKFPYDCPAGIHHWTLWSRTPLDEERIENLVENHIQTNLPHCIAWGYDDNSGAKSFEIEHVHVYFQLPDSSCEPKAAGKAVNLTSS